MLLLPAAWWYHYLVALLPVGALAWGAARPPDRLCIVAGAAAITLAIAWLPLALIGTALLALGSLHAFLRAERGPLTVSGAVTPVAAHGGR
jgi:hypothetical protein